MTSAGSIFVDLLLRDNNYNAGWRRASQTTKQQTSIISAQIASLSRVAAGAFAGLTAGAVFTKFIQNTINAQNEQAQLAAVLKSTGNAAGFTIQQLNKMSSVLSSQSIFSGGEITNAQTRLLSYAGILGENVPRAMQAVIDQSARLGISLEQSAETIGRALEQPSKAAAALSRQGFGSYFTKETIDMLKALEEQGRVAEAQVKILEVLEESYAGAALAARQTLGGAIRNLNNTINGIVEDPNGLPGLARLINEVSISLQNAANDSNLFETMAYGWAASLIEVYKAYNQVQIAYRESTNVFGLNNKLIEEYTENVNKATAALDRLAIELAGRKEQQSSGQQPIDFSRPSLPTNQRTTIESDNTGVQAKKQRELQSLYDRNRELILGLDGATLKYNDTLDELNKLLSENIITDGEFSLAVQRLNEDFEKNRETVNEWGVDVSEFGKKAAQNIQDAFADFLFDPFEDGMRGMLKNFVDTLRRMMAEAAATRLSEALLGGGSSKSGGLLSGLFGGGGFNMPTGLPTRAISGPAAGSWVLPTFAEGGYLGPGEYGIAGEAGAELIYGGKTGVSVFNQDQLSGGGGNTYYVDAKGADSGAVRRLEQALLALAGPGVIEQRVVNAQTRGSL